MDDLIWDVLTDSPRTSGQDCRAALEKCTSDKGDHLGSSAKVRHAGAMLKPVRVLMVEDSPAEVELAREAMSLHKLGINMDVVQDGTEALAYLRNEGKFAEAPLPDLILLDLNLPRMNGRELLRIIKKEPQWRKIPVVVLTSSSADQDVLAAYDLGANCYVTKPVDFDAFQRVIGQLEEFWFSVARLPRSK
jgi:two-component system, chemotaxis family, response regulator Rcp1